MIRERPEVMATRKASYQGPIREANFSGIDVSWSPRLSQSSAVVGLLLDNFRKGWWCGGAKGEREK